jgi:hypothetical protein
MTPSELPQVVLAKLFQMQSHVEHCNTAAASADRACDEQRAMLNDRRPRSMREHRDKDGWNLAAEQQKLATLTQRAAGFRQIAATEAGILKRCRAWLDALPAVGLEPVAPSLAADDTLPLVRQRLSAVQAELKQLNSVPLPDPDLKRKVESYVSSLAARAAPELRGVAAGDTFQPRWKFDAFDEVYPAAVLVAAWLTPERLADRLLSAARQLADQLVPASERPARIQALRDEILPLRYAEEALVTRALANGEAAARSPDSPPEAVLLVRVKAKPTKPALREAAESSPSAATVSPSAEMIGVSP